MSARSTHFTGDPAAASDFMVPAPWQAARAQPCGGIRAAGFGTSPSDGLCLQTRPTPPTNQGLRGFQGSGSPRNARNACLAAVGQALPTTKLIGALPGFDA